MESFAPNHARRPAFILEHGDPDGIDLAHSVWPGRAVDGPLQFIVDNMGLKLNGPGEWLVEKHGTTKRRSWHKLHIGLDAVSGKIVASTLTGRDIDDSSEVAALLDQVDGSVGVFMGDGAYDSADVYAAVEERYPDALVRQLTNFPHPA